MSRYTNGAKAVGCLFFLTLPVWMMLRAWVLSILWGWFMPSPVGPIGMAQAYGLALLVSLFVGVKSSAKNEKDYDGETLLAELLPAFVTPLILLAIGWGAHEIMVRP